MSGVYGGSTSGGGSVYGSGGAAPTTVPSFSYGWNPLTDLGHAASQAYNYVNPIGALKTTAMGIGQAIGAPIVSAGQSLVSAATGNWGQAGKDAVTALKGVADLPTGLFMGAENLGADVAHTIPGFSGTYDNAVARFNLATSQDLWSHVISDSMKQNLRGAATTAPDGSQIQTGAKPQDLLQQASHGGLGSAVIAQLGTLSMVAGPVAGALGSSSATTLGAAADLSTAGDLAGAAELASKAIKLDKATQVAEAVAHPIKFVSDQTAGFLKANQLASQATEAAKVADVPVVPETLTPADHAAAMAAVDARTQGAEAMTADHSVATSVHNQPTDLVNAERPNLPSSSHRMATAEEQATAAAKYDAVKRGRKQEYMTDQEIVADNAAHGGQTPTEEFAQVEQQRVQSTGTKVPPQMAQSDIMPGDSAARIAADEAAARANAPVMDVVNKLGQKIAMPPPAWAQRVAEALPDSVNKILGKVANGTVDKIQWHALQRNWQQFGERAQNHARSNTFTHAGQAAANEIWAGDRTFTTEQLSQAVGQEIIKRVNGEQMAQNYAKDIMGNADVIPPEIQTKMLEAAGSNYPGITEAMTKNLSVEAKARLEEIITAGKQAYIKDAGDTFQTLLSTRYGGRGLESSMIDPNEPIMSAKDVKQYRQVMSDLRRSKEWQAKLPDLQQRAYQQAKQSAFHGNRLSDEQARLQDKMGINRQTQANLHDGIPPGLETPEAIDATAHGLLAEATQSEAGGGTFVATVDPATGEIIHDTKGFTATSAHQAIVQPGEDIVAAIKRAITSPMTHDGTGRYDPANLWAGADSHLSISRLPDNADGTPGGVTIDITQSTINGKPMNLMQSTTLGEAFGQSSIHDNTNGIDLPLSLIPDVQHISANYLPQILDPASNLNKWYASNADAIAAHNAHADLIGPVPYISPQQLMRETQNRMVFDYAFATRNVDHQLGDLFNSELQTAKGLPRNDALYQGTAVDLTTAQGVEAALKTYEGTKLTNILGWYHDSHAYIEKMWRYNTDGTEKLMPITGRSAAETFYDVLAFTSVMASPLQNLGRALMSFSNLEDFLQSQKDALAAADSIMKKASKLPDGYTYVSDMGKTGEKGKGPATYGNESINKPGQQTVHGTTYPGERGPGKGTAISTKFFETPELRKLTEGTSMVTSPKYNVIDVLMGKYDLSKATNDSIDKLPEFWSGTRKGLSDAGLTPERINYWANLYGIDPNTPALLKLNAAQDTLDHLQAEKANPTPQISKPISEAEMRKQQGMGEGVSPGHFQQLAYEGKDNVDQRIAAGSPPIGLEGPQWSAVMHDAYTATHTQTHDYTGVNGENGGVTIDAHTGENFVAHTDGTSDITVTARLPGMKTITIKPGASEAVFTAAMENAKTQFADVLASKGGQLGVFHNVVDGKGVIEIDPTYTVNSVDESHTIGAYTHASGGAYNHQTTNAEWTPHVQDIYRTKGTLSSGVTAAKAAVRDAMHAPELSKAYEQAMMEHTGQAGLAKIRSFRANLSDPTHSLAVTLDSVMAKLYGLDKTDWGTGTNYADYATEIRDAATMLSTRLGRPVMPHEVQALLWVYTKEFVGNQDWGRLLAHRDAAMAELQRAGDAISQGGHADVAGLKLLDDWRQEELGYSKNAQDVRSRRSELSKQAVAARKGTKPPLTAAEQTELSQLQQFPTIHQQPVRVDTSFDKRSVPTVDGTYRSDLANTEGATYETVNRHESPYDSKVLAAKTAQFDGKWDPKTRKFVGGYDQVKADIAAELAKGTVDGATNARVMLDQYVAGWEKPIRGDAEGGNFKVVGDYSRGPVGIKGDFSAALAERNLHTAEYVPSPGAVPPAPGLLEDSFKGQVRGVTLTDAGKTGKYVARLYSGADFTTLLHEDMHLLRLIAPPDEIAHLQSLYPHISDAVLTPARRAAEEKFVADFMTYLHDKIHNSQMPQLQSPNPAFRSAAQFMDDTYASHLTTAAGSTVGNDVRNYFDGIFHPNIVKPTVYTDPLSAQYAPPPGGVDTVARRWESPAQYAQRTRQYGEARQRQVTLEQRAQALNQQRAKVDRATNNLMSIWQQGGEAGIAATNEANKLAASAATGLAAIRKNLGDPSINNVPRAWRPMVSAFQGMAAVLREDPNAGEMALILNEIPATFADVMKYAADHGFEPTYVPEMTMQIAEKYMYRHLNLSADPEMAGLRKVNKGVLSGADAQARSMEALSAGSVMATKEAIQSRIIGFVEKYYAKPMPANRIIPADMESWDSARAGLITGKTPGGQTVAVNAGDTSYIIPKNVGDALRKMQQPYSTWGGDTGVPHFLLKGGPTALWKNIMLTYSPAWYVKHFLGAVSNAVLAGARWTDFRTAVKQAWTKDEFGLHNFGALPDAVRGRSIWGQTDQEGLHPEGSMLHKSMTDQILGGQKRAALASVRDRLRGVVKTTDALGRAAVYAQRLRTGFSAEEAASAAYSALGDFNNLSGIERGLVSTILPFYPFQKAMLKIVTRLPVDHPIAASLFVTLGQMHQAQLEQQLGGSIPDNLIGSGMFDGKLISYAKINPLIDTFKLVSPTGLLQSAHPFIQLFMQEGLHAPSFGSGVGQGEYGQLVSKPDWTSTIGGMFTSSPLGGVASDPFGGGGVSPATFGSPVKQYSDAQWAALIKRLAATAKAVKTFDTTPGAYTSLGVNKPKNPNATVPGASVYG